ncbi:MAG: hypothetical protein ACJ77D_14050 [Chloroflexota bacterium]
MRPALYTFLVGVAIMAVVALLLAAPQMQDALTVCGGTQTTGPNGEIKCAGIPPQPPNGIAPRPIDYR